MSNNRKIKDKKKLKPLFSSGVLKCARAPREETLAPPEDAPRRSVTPPADAHRQTVPPADAHRRTVAPPADAPRRTVSPRRSVTPPADAHRQTVAPATDGPGPGEEDRTLAPPQPEISKRIKTFHCLKLDVDARRQIFQRMNTFYQKYEDDSEYRLVSMKLFPAYIAYQGIPQLP